MNLKGPEPLATRPATSKSMKSVKCVNSEKAAPYKPLSFLGIVRNHRVIFVGGDPAEARILNKQLLSRFGIIIRFSSRPNFPNVQYILVKFKRPPWPQRMKDVS